MPYVTSLQRSNNANDNNNNDDDDMNFIDSILDDSINNKELLANFMEEFILEDDNENDIDFNNLFDGNVDMQLENEDLEDIIMAE